MKVSTDFVSGEPLRDSSPGEDGPVFERIFRWYPFTLNDLPQLAFFGRFILLDKQSTVIVEISHSLVESVFFP